MKLSHHKGKKFVIAEDFKETLSDGHVIIIPKGFVTDLSSVPRLLWWLISPFGDFIKASVLHDFLYHLKFDNRKYCDYQMLYMSNRDSKNKLDNYLRYYTVRLFGWLYW